MDAFIPARGGSKRLIGKNLLEVGGLPLVVRAIQSCQRVPGIGRVLVSTDSPEIASIAVSHGAEVVQRPEHLAVDSASVDDLVEDFLKDQLYWSLTGLLVVQPTVVASPEDMHTALVQLASGRWDTSVSAGVKPHSLTWTELTPPLRETQFSDLQSDYPLQEIGLRFYPAGRKSGEVHRITEVTGTFIDIDTPEDLAAARQLIVEPKRILFHVAHSPFVGYGHLNRAVTIAKELQHHEIAFHFNDSLYVPDDFPFPVTQSETEVSFNPADLIIADILNTTEHQMLRWRNEASVITFEDLGGGAKYANAVVNALYANSGLHNEYSGADYAILRPEFRNTGFSRNGVLVTFGGADFLNLTDRLYAMYGSRDDFVFVNPPYGVSQIGMKNPSMGKLMNKVSVVITSAGRTLLEAAACGTPAIVIAQNIRETTHSHLGLDNGNVYLGLGHLVSNAEIITAVSSLLENYSFQDDLSDKALQSIDNKGLQRVLNIINEVLL